MTEYAEKMQYRHPPIQEHLVYLHLTCMYMYIYVIFTAHIYVCIYAVTILFNATFHYRGFNQHFIIVGNTVGKSPTGILTLFICLVLKPLKLQNVWRIFRPSRVFLYCKYAEYACKLQTNLSMNNKQCKHLQKTCNIVL